MENAPFKLDNAKKRAACMIYNRLKGYAKACKDFCNERRGTGRKHVLPEYLYTKRCLVKVKKNGDYEIHPSSNEQSKNSDPDTGGKGAITPSPYRISN